MAPSRTLYVRDSYRNDVTGAHGAGLVTCWYNPEGVRPADPGILPDLEIRSLGELLPALQPRPSA